MTVELDRKSLECLVKGSEPPFERFDHPLVRRAGHSYSDQYGKTIWNNLSRLTDEELYRLHLICTDES